jgi:hypothetical protein
MHQVGATGIKQPTNKSTNQPTNQPTNHRHREIEKPFRFFPVTVQSDRELQQGAELQFFSLTGRDGYLLLLLFPVCSHFGA